MMRGLDLDERSESFQWLFQTFLKAHGQKHSKISSIQIKIQP
jgi:hypothetical protein